MAELTPQKIQMIPADEVHKLVKGELYLVQTGDGRYFIMSAMVDYRNQKLSLYDHENFDFISEERLEILKSIAWISPQ